MADPLYTLYTLVRERVCLCLGGQIGLLELSEELGGGTLGCAMGEVEDYGGGGVRMLLGGVLEAEWMGETYTPQRSPRRPCRCSQSGLLPVGRTRRSGAWGRGIPWTRRIL